MATKTKPHTNGKPARKRLDPETRAKIAALRAEKEAIHKEFRDEMEAEKKRKQRELDWLRSLLAHPHAEFKLTEARELTEQMIGTVDEGLHLVGMTVLVEAMKALREKAGVAK